MKKEKQQRPRPCVHRALRRRIVALSLGLWLAAMVLLTWAVAADMQVQIENKVYTYTDIGDRDVIRGDLPAGLPGELEAGMIDNLGWPYYWLDPEPLLPLEYESNGVSSDDWIWGKWDLYFGFEAATAYFDSDGELLMKSGNYLSFVYTTQENWEASNVDPLGHGYVDLDAAPGAMEAFDDLIDDYPAGTMMTSLLLPMLRLTGWFEGAQFHPVTVDRAFPVNFYNDYPATLNRMDGKGNLEWSNMLTLEAPAGQELVTIYTWENGGVRFDTAPVTVEGERYEDLTDLLVTREREWGGFDSNNLFESVYVWSKTRTDSHGEYVYALAVRYWPLQYAAMRLLPAYLVSLALVGLILLLVLRRIRSSLTMPLELLADKTGRNAPITPSGRWEEIRALEEHCEQTRQALHEANTQIARLNTALDYAQNAEESRRKLVSNITHELKTPLAVIHSYAEGLQAGIAGDKRDQYLEVILEETEKMDAMVLQMLDLSRLEAGRVRLQGDQFSLLGLTRAVVEKLAPMAEKKGLGITYGLAEDFLLTADEARMEQVIANLVNNAIKYSTEGGCIHINVYTHQTDACFSIDNSCPHLSPEALEKVWDSFYRADPSRTEPGTGLGLTIVRSIVELHRGTCSVRNTTLRSGETVTAGVEFGFRIPM